MCSLTFLPKPGGYFVAMNRDENLGREIALPPRVHTASARTWIGPEERSSGGMWIATSDSGVTLALLNAHPGGAVSPSNMVLSSRGLLIPGLIGARDHSELASKLATLPLNVPPFRLVAIFPAERALWIHIWTGHGISAERAGWSMQQIFSSGLSDEAAATTRVATTRALPRAEGEDEQQWVRRLHASHVPERGAFSYCVHRADARTVSYTEIDIGEETILMRYHNGSPCELDASQFLGSAVELTKTLLAGRN